MQVVEGGRVTAGGWEQQARCRREDPSLFFGPVGFESKQDRQRRESDAKTVCAVCPVVSRCREHALAANEAYGVWGGLGELDRRTLVVQHEPALAAVRAG